MGQFKPSLSGALAGAGAGAAIGGPFGAIAGGLIGGSGVLEPDVAQAQNPYEAQINQQIAQLQSDISKPSSLAAEQYKKMAGEAAARTNQAIGATRGLTPEAAADLQRSQGGNMQAQAAQNAAVVALQDKAQKQALLNSLMMGAGGQAMSAQQAQIQQQLAQHQAALQGMGAVGSLANQDWSNLFGSKSSGGGMGLSDVPALQQSSFAQGTPSSSLGNYGQFASSKSNPYSFNSSF